MKNLLRSDEDFRFNEILFENRNKSYGSYVLRNEEGLILQKSMFIGVALFAALAVTPLMVNVFTIEKVVSPPPIPEFEFTPIPHTPDKAPEIAKPLPAAPPKVNTYDSRVATPTRDAQEPKPITTAQKVDAVPGIHTSLDNPPLPNVAPPVIAVPAVLAPPVSVPAPIDNSPQTIVDVEASFIGGINAFRNKVVGNFNADGFEGTGDVIKTTVTFIVERDGTISNIKAAGKNAGFNLEAEKTIRNLKGKWTPAKLNGQVVRSYFKFPISMQFE